MTIPRAEIQSLTPGAIVELFKVDASGIGGSVYYLCSQLNPLGANVVWQGTTYTAFPIAASGFEASTTGALPHPTLSVSNLDGLMSGLVDSLYDLVGAIVTRHQVLVKYLDAANFSGGNATADPTAGFADDVWVVEQKMAETADSITFDLVAASDAQGLMLPARVIQTSNCPSAYKNGDGTGMCPYAGAMPSCDHGLLTLNGCRAHFPVVAGVAPPLPFGGFPGAQAITGQ